MFLINSSIVCLMHHVCSFVFIIMNVSFSLSLSPSILLLCTLMCPMFYSYFPYFHFQHLCELSTG